MQLESVLKKGRIVVPCQVSAAPSGRRPGPGSIRPLGIILKRLEGKQCIVGPAYSGKAFDVVRLPLDEIRFAGT
jgi:hypothetical protein